MMTSSHVFSDTPKDTGRIIHIFNSIKSRENAAKSTKKQHKFCVSNKKGRTCAKLKAHFIEEPAGVRINAVSWQ